MRVLLAISKGIDTVTTWMAYVLFWLTLIMVLLGAYNVVTRYVGRAMNEALGGTVYIALQTYAYNLIFLLGAGYVFNKDGHVRVDILYSNYSERTKAWVDIILTFIFLIPFCIMGIYFSLGYVESSWRQQEVNMNAGGIAVYPIKTVIPIAFGFLIFQGISEVIKRIAFLRGISGYEHHDKATDEMEAV